MARSHLCPTRAKRDVKSDPDLHPYKVTGHIGYSFDGGKTIYGFGPSIGEGKFENTFDAIRSLRKGASYPGIVTVDTDVFKDVAKNPDTAIGGAPQQVIQQDIPVTKEEFDAIKNAHDSAGKNTPMDGVNYGFPGKSDPSSVNCATYPKKIGIPIPEETGALEKYIPALEKEGKPWKS